MREASAHWLRHEMLTALANNNGGDRKAAQDHAGHENIATLQATKAPIDADPVRLGKIAASVF